MLLTPALLLQRSLETEPHPTKRRKALVFSLLTEKCTLQLQDWSAPRERFSPPRPLPLPAPIHRPALVQSTFPAAHRQLPDTASFAAHPPPSAPGHPERFVST